LASAQSAFDLNIGFGAIHDKANPAQVDQNLNTCPNTAEALPCVSTPALSGFMMGFGGDLMLKKKFGIGAEVALQPGKETYVNLNASAAANGLTAEAIQSRMTSSSMRAPPPVRCSAARANRSMPRALTT
jgi:hypothetical protein